MNSPQPRRPGWALHVLIVLVFTLAVGLGVWLWVRSLAPTRRPPGPGGNHAGQDKDKDPGRPLAQQSAGAPATGPEEKLVRAYILDNADDPKTVEFVSWGPHDLEGKLWRTEVVTALQAKEGRKIMTLRVKYRCANNTGAKVLRDDLAFLQDGKVLLAGPNDLGDNWKTISPLHRTP